MNQHEQHRHNLLRESKELLEVILKNAADGITAQDTTGALIFANDAAAHLLGYGSVEEMLEAPSLEYMTKFIITDENGEQISIDKLPGRRALQGEKNPEMLLRSVNKKTGDIAWSHVQSSAIYDKSGIPYIVVNVMQNITDIKEVEHRKDDFINMASHELKTPVTSIMLLISALKSDIMNKEWSDALGLAGKIEQQTKRLCGLITDILEVPHIESGELQLKKEVFDLSGLVQEILQSLEETTDNHTFHFQSSAGFFVQADRYRIFQVLSSIFSNAIKYSPSGGNISIAIEKENGYLIARITDTGIGIDSFHHKKIFEKFYRVEGKVEKTYPGLGIGLYIAREIIRQHNGNIWVESEKGKGSCFYFSLPIKINEL